MRLIMSVKITFICAILFSVLLSGYAVSGKSVKSASGNIPSAENQTNQTSVETETNVLSEDRTVNS